MNNKKIYNNIQKIEYILLKISEIKQYYKSTCRENDIDNTILYNVSKHKRSNSKSFQENKLKIKNNDNKIEKKDIDIDIDNLRKYYPMIFEDISSLFSVEEIKKLSDSVIAHFKKSIILIIRKK